MTRSRTLCAVARRTCSGSRWCSPRLGQVRRACVRPDRRRPPQASPAPCEGDRSERRHCGRTGGDRRIPGRATGTARTVSPRDQVHYLSQPKAPALFLGGGRLLLADGGALRWLYPHGRVFWIDGQFSGARLVTNTLWVLDLATGQRRTWVRFPIPPLRGATIRPWWWMPRTADHSCWSTSGQHAERPSSLDRLDGKVILVTGASRGGGRGIAVALGGEGATVYVTGRSTRTQAAVAEFPHAVEDTAEEVTAAGGHGIAAPGEAATWATSSMTWPRTRCAGS